MSLSKVIPTVAAMSHQLDTPSTSATETSTLFVSEDLGALASDELPWKIPTVQVSEIITCRARLTQENRSYGQIAPTFSAKTRGRKPGVAQQMLSRATVTKW